MAGVDDIIKQWVAKVEETGELRNSPYWGKPFDFNDGYLDTPTELRMAYKILKNAGYVPAEVEMLNTLAALKEKLAAAVDPKEQTELRKQMTQLQHKIAMMFDNLKRKR